MPQIHVRLDCTRVLLQLLERVAGCLVMVVFAQQGLATQSHFSAQRLSVKGPVQPRLGCAARSDSGRQLQCRRSSGGVDELDLLPCDYCCFGCGGLVLTGQRSQGGALLLCILLP